MSGIQMLSFTSCMDSAVTQHVPPSQIVKDNLLAMYPEVDRIKWSLKENPDSLVASAERLISISVFNRSLAQFIVGSFFMKPGEPEMEESKKAELASQFIYPELANDMEKLQFQMSVDRFFFGNLAANFNREYEQVRLLAPMCQQLSGKIERLFQKTPLVQFRSQLPESIDINAQIPEQFRFSLSSAPRIPETVPVSLAASSSSSVDDSVVAAPVSRIVISFEAKSGDKLFIRGTGPGMSWSRGVEMRREGSFWVFETTEPFEKFEYKIARNDKVYERASNQRITFGQMPEPRSVRF